MDTVFKLSIILILYMIASNYFNSSDSSPIDSIVVNDTDEDKDNISDGLESISCKMDTRTLKTFNQGIKLTESSRFQQMVDIKNREYVDLQNFDSKEKEFNCTICNPFNCNYDTTPSIKEEKLMEGYVNLPNDNGLTNEFIDGDKCCPNCYTSVMVDGEKKCRKVCNSGDFQDYSGDCLSKKKFTEFIQGNASF